MPSNSARTSLEIPSGAAITPALLNERLRTIQLLIGSAAPAAASTGSASSAAAAPAASVLGVWVKPLVAVTTFTPDFSKGTNFEIVLPAGGPFVIANPINAAGYAAGVLWIVQPPGGGVQVTLGAWYAYPNIDPTKWDLTGGQGICVPIQFRAIGASPQIVLGPGGVSSFTSFPA
jgi:hypothetical protein